MCHRNKQHHGLKLTKVYFPLLFMCPLPGLAGGSLFISLLGARPKRAAIVPSVTSHHDRIKENLHPRGPASSQSFQCPK